MNLAGTKQFLDIDMERLTRLAARAHVSTKMVKMRVRETVERMRDVWPTIKDMLPLADDLRKEITEHMTRVPLFTGERAISSTIESRSHAANVANGPSPSRPEKAPSAVTDDELNGTLSNRIRIGRHRRDRGISVSRPTALGNPFVVGKPYTRAEAIARYRDWFRDKLTAEDPGVLAQLRDIEARAREGAVTLLCWCAPLACHAEVIAAHVEVRLATDGTGE